MAFDRRAYPAGAAFGAWTAPDGWAHRRMDWRQAEGVAPRGSLLFAGGRGDFIEKYLEAFAHWHGRGWNVTAFDWRSQGGSRGDIAGGHLDSLDILVGDLHAFLAAWRKDGPGPHVAIGHSMGGHVLLRVLAERTLSLDAAVLVAPMIAINTGLLPAWSASWLAASLAMLGWSRQPAWRQPGPFPAGSFRQAILTGSLERFEDERYWWTRYPGYNLGPPSWGWLDAAYRSSGRLTPAALAAVAVPILLLGAEGDRLVSPAAIRRAASLIPGAQLEMFARSGHEILRERDEVRLAAHARIDAFLEEKAPA